jgi:hypothetical protein
MNIDNEIRSLDNLRLCYLIFFISCLITYFLLSNITLIYFAIASVIMIEIQNSKILLLRIVNETIEGGEE